MDILNTLGTGGILLLAIVLVLLLAFCWWLWHRAHQPPRELHRLLRSHSHSMLVDIIIPDGMDGRIHLDYLLLTADGLWVVDTLNVQGVVFGALRMDNWAVMRGHKRHTFRNPLHGLQDRVAAVKGLAPGVPVEGKVVFCRGASFPKGVPEGTLEYHSLPWSKGDKAPGDDLVAAWQKMDVASNDL